MSAGEPCGLVSSKIQKARKPEIMIVRAIDPTLVDAGSRLRALDPAWVALLAGEISLDGQLVPIRVVERGGRFLLIDGARRLAAVLKIGGQVDARVEPEAALADAAVVRLGEIKGNLMRGELTMLERAYYVAAWREVYLSAHTPKRGPKPKGAFHVQRTRNSAEASTPANDDAADPFVLSLAEAAQQALQISQKTLYRYLEIAKIPSQLGHRLVGHASADSRVELMILAGQTAVRQAIIVDLILSDDERIGTIAEAIAHLDGASDIPKLSPPERIHQTFCRLPQPQQEAFFDLNAEAIERWSAARAAKPARIRSVA